MAAVLLLAPAMAFGLAASRGAAQQPSTVTLTGVVLDASSGAPVGGALLSLGEQGPRAIANPSGRFTMAGVATGTQRLRVQRFGYTDLELTLSVGQDPAPLDLRMEVDPVALQGLVVTGNAKVSLSGIVLDAETRDPLPWAEVWLSRDLRRQTGRASGDAQGVFHIPNVVTDRYFLRVERVGYESQYVVVDVMAPPEPVEVHLRPDTTVQRGLAIMTGHFNTRRAASPYLVRNWGEERLRMSAAPGMRHFLEYEAALPLFPCNDRSASKDCIEERGRLLPLRVFIDELPAFGLDQLGSYDPHEFYSVEFFRCGPAPPMIRAYTYQYMERMARRPRIVLPPCG